MRKKSQSVNETTPISRDGISYWEHLSSVKPALLSSTGSGRKRGSSGRSVSSITQSAASPRKQKPASSTRLGKLGRRRRNTAGSMTGLTNSVRTLYFSAYIPPDCSEKLLRSLLRSRTLKKSEILLPKVEGSWHFLEVKLQPPSPVMVAMSLDGEVIMPDSQPTGARPTDPSSSTRPKEGRKK